MSADELKTAKQMRVCYVPLDFAPHTLHLKAMRNVDSLTNVINPVDLIFIYLENEGLTKSPDIGCFSDFRSVFQDEAWLKSWEEDILKEVEIRRLKETPEWQIKKENLLSCEVFYNGVTLFLFEKDTQQHINYHEFYGAVVEKLALHLPPEIYQQYSMFDFFCQIDSES